MTSHLEESLQRDLAHIRERIASMAELGARTLRDGVTASEKRDRQLAYVMILRDQRVDQLQKEIDQLCLEFLLRHQPAGSHLRFVYSALQINSGLERVGDYAESIARQLIKLMELNCPIPPGLFTEISSASISMLHNAVNAFVRQDADLAEVTAQIEERVDTLRNQANSELLHLVQSGQVPLAALTPLMTIARRFERVSDQAKSFCQETIYLCTGEYAKHAGSHLYRVLFVDEHHSCLSRLAERLGQALDRPEFSFASAGLDPRPLDSSLAKYLRERGVGPAEFAPQPIPTGTDFEQFSIVIAFSPETARQLPSPSRKTVQLDWSMADPCLSPGTPEEIRARLDQASEQIGGKLSGLISALFPEEQTTGVHL